MLHSKAISTANLDNYITGNKALNEFADTRLETHSSISD